MKKAEIDLELETVYNLIKNSPKGITFTEIMRQSKMSDAHLAVRISGLICANKIQTNNRQGRLFYTAKDANIAKEVNV